MSILLDLLLILLLFLLFASFHTFLASNKVKKLIDEIFPGLLPFYRIFYNLVSLISFYFFYNFAPKPDIEIYDLSSPWDMIILIPQALSIAGIFWTLKYFDLKEFVGIGQILRWRHKNYINKELDEHKTLHIGGPYRFCRHPLYFFSILFIGFRPTMSLFYLTAFICISIYFYIGSLFEEEKLVESFGEIYLNYQKTTPRLIPFLHF